MKITLKAVGLIAIFILFLAVWPKLTFASNSIKPQLAWQRSAEASDKVVTETAIGTKLIDALSLPLDPNQQVFDDGIFTPQINKNRVQPQVHWASWPQYSAGPGSCGPTKELRHFQAKFTLASVSQIQSIKLKSLYYPNNTFPINDNAYIYLNGHYITRLGTSYSATSLGFNGTAPYANETDGWVGNGDLGSSPIQFLQVRQNILDIVAGETCRWGGMGKLELVFEQSAPQPFLDLPWDYQRQGKSFEDVGLNPFSWFDHKYPLQNQCCNPPVMKYTGEIKDESYQSHDGYDYSSKDGVYLNTPIIAAASGWATFKSWQNSGGAGNIIKIDHGNGYQTWYEHLQPEGLVLSEENGKVFVNKGQVIGKVGMTGNTNGPHIHFSVFYDRDGDGFFDDELPFGATDPLGWEGASPDPWPTDKDGATSLNLFEERKQLQSAQIPLNGGSLSTDKVKINVPAQASNQQFSLSFKNGPFEFISNFIKSVVPTFFLNATDDLNQPIASFSKPISISYDYSGADLANINENTLQLYSFDEQAKQWDPITTTLDKINKIASGETLHFSQFALMGEVRDVTAPSTKVIITGDKGYNDWYKSDVTVQLVGEDNENGIGLQYTLYTLNGNNWFEYKGPLIFSQEGDYKITYQSFDKAENMEDRKNIEFHIDKTPPQVSIEANPTILWPPNGEMVDITIQGSSFDDHIRSTNLEVIDEYKQLEPTIEGFGQVIQLQAQGNGSDEDGRTYTIKVIAEDLAGNKSEGQVEVRVVHDQRNRK